MGDNILSIISRRVDYFKSHLQRSSVDGDTYLYPEARFKWNQFDCEWINRTDAERDESLACRCHGEIKSSERDRRNIGRVSRGSAVRSRDTRARS